MRALGTGSDLLTCDGAPLAVGVATLLRQVPPPPPARPEFHVPPAVLLRGGLSLPVAVAPPMTGCGSSARGLGGGRACEGLCSAVGGGGEQLHSSATRDLLGHIAQYVRCHAVLASRAAADAKAAAALKASRGPPRPRVKLGPGGVWCGPCPRVGLSGVARDRAARVRYATHSMAWVRALLVAARVRYASCFRRLTYIPEQLVLGPKHKPLQHAAQHATLIRHGNMRLSATATCAPEDAGGPSAGAAAKRSRCRLRFSFRARK